MLEMGWLRVKYRVKTQKYILVKPTVLFSLKNEHSVAPTNVQFI